jgi:16S rRNA (adenine1518-N6/adenine1519-N6)-dimethyltransferase
MALKNKKSLGQNWLKDRDILLDIADMASTDGVNEVLEIGPGLGTLTSALFQFFDKVTAVELDERLAANLPKSFPGKDLVVINKDILSLDISSLNLPDKYVVAGNIPYYITSPIIQKFLHAEHRPAKIVLLMQKEVAERLTAQPGDYSILGLSAQIYAKVTAGPIVNRTFFTPPPKVDSQVVILEPLKQPLATERTISLIKLGFSSPRKKLITNLAVAGHISKEQLTQLFEQLGISLNARPADLSIEDWAKLEKNLQSS